MTIIYAYAKANPPNLAIFVSGRGSHLQHIHSGIESGSLQARIAVVVSNKMTCKGIEYAKRTQLTIRQYPSDDKEIFTLSESLKSDFHVDYIILAGFIKRLPTVMVRAFTQKILNIHPSLLPKYGGFGFFGIKVHQAVIASGDTVSGATVHFVDAKYDTGPIIAQNKLLVRPGESPQSLAMRILHLEKELYIFCIIALIEERIIWQDPVKPIIIPPSS